MKYAIIDYRTTSEEILNLKKAGCQILIIPPSKILYEAVCGHPDMLLHIVDKKNIILHKDMDVSFINTLRNLDLNITLSENSLKSAYPYDIILNSVNLSNLFIHKIKYTDPKLLEMINTKKLINVKQGYTKCSTALVTKNAVMTSDKTIANALLKENIDVLLLPPGDILLPGLDYGFIGGCCGLIDEYSLAFFGNLNYYMYGDIVLSFLEKHNVKPIYLKQGRLIDRGSLLIINT